MYPNSPLLMNLKSFSSALNALLKASMISTTFVPSSIENSSVVPSGKFLITVSFSIFIEAMGLQQIYEKLLSFA